MRGIRELLKGARRQLWCLVGARKQKSTLQKMSTDWLMVPMCEMSAEGCKWME